jgi:hypothetical protein
MRKNKIQPIPLMDGDAPPDQGTPDPKSFAGWHDPQDSVTHDPPKDSNPAAFVWPDLPGVEPDKPEPPNFDGKMYNIAVDTINVPLTEGLKTKDCAICVSDKDSPFEPPCSDCATPDDESKKHFRPKTCNNCRHWGRPPNSSPCLEGVCVDKSRWVPGVISLGDNNAGVVSLWDDRKGTGDRKTCRTCGYFDTPPGQHPCKSDFCKNRSYWTPRLASQKGEVNHGH